MTPQALRKILVCLVIGLQLVTIVTLTTSTKNRLQNQFELNATLTANNLADALTEQVRLFISPIEAQLSSAQALIEDGLINSHDDKELGTSFQSLLRSNSWLKGVFLGRPDGSFVRVNQTANHERLRTKIISYKSGNREVTNRLVDNGTQHTWEWQEESGTYDPRERNWYQIALDNPGVNWADPFPLYTSGLPGITSSTRLRTASGTPLGVLSFAIDLRKLTKFVSNTLKDTHGSAILLDKNGTVVAYSDKTLFEATALRGGVPHLQQVTDEPLTFYYNILETSDSRKSAASSHYTTHQFESAGESYLGLSRPVTLSAGKIEWQLVFAVPIKVLTGEMDQFMDQNLVALVAMVAFFGLIALLLVFKVTAPVYQLYQRATTDHLTAALNRDEFERQLGTLLEEQSAHRGRAHLVAVVMDLDGFKQINDHHGHAAGDIILRTVVKRLKAQVPRAAIIGRLGGDEFALAIRIPAHCNAQEWIENLRANVVQSPVKTKGNKHGFGMTCGISYATRSDTIDTLLARADQALIEGKTQEKNRSYVWQATLTTTMTTTAKTQQQVAA